MRSIRGQRRVLGDAALCSLMPAFSMGRMHGKVAMTDRIRTTTPTGLKIRSAQNDLLNRKVGKDDNR